MWGYPGSSERKCDAAGEEEWREDEMKGRGKEKRPGRGEGMEGEWDVDQEQQGKGRNGKGGKLWSRGLQIEQRSVAWLPLEVYEVPKTRSRSSEILIFRWCFEVLPGGPDCDISGLPALE